METLDAYTYIYIYIYQVPIPAVQRILSQHSQTLIRHTGLLQHMLHATNSNHQENNCDSRAYNHILGRTGSLTKPCGNMCTLGALNFCRLCTDCTEITAEAVTDRAPESREG